VTGTLIGVLTAEKLVLSSWVSRAVVTLLFAMFSYSNLVVGIVSAVQIRTAALSMVNEEQLGSLKTAGDGPPAWLYILFHLAFDLAVIIVVWYWPGRRRHPLRQAS
jgi:hypothetical protein